MCRERIASMPGLVVSTIGLGKTCISAIKGPLPVRLVRISLPTVMRSEQNTRRHTPNCINTEYHSQKPTRFKTEFFCLSLNRLMIMFAKMATACGMDSAELAL